MSAVEWADDPYDDDAEADYETDPGPTWDDDRANWHIRKLAKVRREIARVQSMYDDEIARLRERRDRRLSILLSAAAWHELPLIAYHAAKLAEDPTHKTHYLTGGEIHARVYKTPKYEVDDRDAFTAWAITNEPDLVVAKWQPVVRAIERFAKAAGDRAVTPYGEVIPGLTALVPPPSFTVKTDDT